MCSRCVQTHFRPINECSTRGIVFLIIQYILKIGIIHHQRLRIVICLPGLRTRRGGGREEEEEVNPSCSVAASATKCNSFI